ncbi:MAG: transcriptional repressor [Clostridia bacterium]|nr:transcriptional repressor [Clostridia bacterium]
MNENKYRNTKQREQILNILLKDKSHPTASDIYDKMKVQFPDLSLGTVYRNLNILVEQGKIQKLDFGSTYDHYDGNCCYHSHFVCRQCKKVYDLGCIEDDIEKVQQTTNHKIESCLKKYYGVCENCL